MATNVDVGSGEQMKAVGLVHRLDGLFTTAFHDIPEHLQREIARRFFPFCWDDLEPEQRETLARAVEGDAPGHRDEFGRWWTLFVERAELLRQIDEWSKLEPKDVTEKAEQEDRIASLQKRVEELDAAIWVRAAPAQRKTRQDAMRREIDAALCELGPRASADEVMAWLKRRAEKDGSSVVNAAPDGVIWCSDGGTTEKLTIPALKERLRRIREAEREAHARPTLRTR